MNTSQMWWYMSIIPATWEVEAGLSQIVGQSGQIWQDPISKTK
jgi:hypothetical protein